MLRRLSYSNVAATLALALAIGGGTAYAASKIGKSDIAYHAVTASKVNFDAITASKVRNSTLSGRDLRDSSVTTADVRNGTLRAEDFAAGSLPKGEKGDKGDPATTLHGTVTAAGALAGGEGVTAVSPADGGVYTVTFDQDVSKCAVIATVATTGADDGGTVTGAPSGSAQQVTFRTRDTAGAAAQRPFQFALFC